MSENEPLKILYVDDDEDIRRIVALSLALDPGIELRTESSGVDALAMLATRSWQPDAIMLDVMMPGMDGPALMQKLRSERRFAETPFLFVTARARTGDIEHFKTLGATAVLTKPFDPLSLASEVRARLSDTSSLKD